MNEKTAKALSAKQKSFCAAYLKYLNVSKAARESGYSLQGAYNLMGKSNIREFISEQKDKLFKNMMVDAYDILNVYLRIAFADIKDFLEIERTEGTHRKPDYLRIKDIDGIDGQIIDELVTTASGIKLKLCDRMKALEKLEKYFELLGEDWRKSIAQEKIKLAALNSAEQNDVKIQVITGIERNEGNE